MRLPVLLRALALTPLVLTAAQAAALVEPVAGLRVNGDAVYFCQRAANEGAPTLQVRLGSSPPRLLIDPDSVDGAATVRAVLDGFAPSPDNQYLAYGLSTGGAGGAVLRIRALATGRDSGEQITRARTGASSWTRDNRLLYTRLAPLADNLGESRVYLHTVGDDPARDAAVFGVGVTPGIEIAANARPAVMLVRGSDHAFGLVGDDAQLGLTVYIAPVETLTDGRPAWRKLIDPRDQIADIAVFANTLFMWSTQGAPQGQVLKLPLGTPGTPGASGAPGASGTPDMARARIVVTASEAAITGIGAARDALYIKRLAGTTSELLRLPYSPGAKAAAIALPDDVRIDALATDVRVPGVLFEARGATRPEGVLAYDPRAAKVVDTALQRAACTMP